MGNVFFTQADGPIIGRLDPLTNIITEWGEFPFGSEPTRISIDDIGNVYYTEPNQNKIGRLDPLTNIITEWDLPTPDSIPGGISVDSIGNVYFTESDFSTPLNENSIGRIS